MALRKAIHGRQYREILKGGEMYRLKKTAPFMKVAENSEKKYQPSLTLVSKDSAPRPYATLGEALKKARQDKGLSQGEVAKMTEFKNAQFISNIERGLALPPSHLMRLFLKIYEIDLEELLKALSLDLVDKYRRKFMDENDLE